MGRSLRPILVLLLLYDSLLLGPALVRLKSVLLCLLAPSCRECREKILVKSWAHRKEREIHTYLVAVILKLFYTFLWDKLLCCLSFVGVQTSVFEFLHLHKCQKSQMWKSWALWFFTALMTKRQLASEIRGIFEYEKSSFKCILPL